MKRVQSINNERNSERIEEFDVVVIGGGASGLMAATVASLQGKKVLILEKNAQLGKKLTISGGGRCNITNAEYDVRKLLRTYGKAEQFLYSAFAQFGVAETFTFFEEHGLPLVVEAQKRAFPHTQKAVDVLCIFEGILKDKHVTISTKTPVLSINTAHNHITSVQTKTGVFTAKSYVLATGGVSHPETGSTGDGFEWLHALGHTVVSPSPEIVPLATAEAWGHALAGITLPSVKIQFFVQGKKAFTKTGPILFTHFGISGPTILNSSGAVADLLQEGPVTAKIDCFPTMDEGALEAHILSIFDIGKNKLFKNVFREIAPQGTSTALLTLLRDIDPETKVHSITREERKRIIALLKALPLTIKRTMGLDRAVVADGGVPLTEIDTRTMRSKLIDNLFVTGDLLHVRRPSGGFSLQLCWTSGYVAGIEA